jgi:hypothetical protein
MAGITGMGDTFDLPNYVGELFGISKEDQPFLSAIGGLTGGVPTNAKRFEWEYYDLRTPAVRVALEGAAAPTAEARVRANASNVLQIVHEAVDVSYTKIAARGQLHADVLVEGSNPVDNEFDWQVKIALKQCARDINYSFINGTFAEPADNNTERKTRGLIEAISTNAIALSDDVRGGDITGEADTELLTSASAHGLAVGDRIEFTTLNGGTGLAINTEYFVRSVPSTTTFTLSTTRGGAIKTFSTDVTTGSAMVRKSLADAEAIGNAMQLAFENGGLQEGETRTALVGPLQKRRLTKALVTDANYQETNRNVGGVNLQVIETDFGPLNIMVDTAMPADTLVFVSLEDCAPVILEIPGRGFLFVEPLAKTGSSERAQIYGEVGLKYGNERKHAKITNAG